MSLRRITYLVLLLALYALDATAAFTTGDVFIGRAGAVERYSNTGTFLQTINTPFLTSETTGMAFDSSGNLYVTSFQGNNITKFDNSGTLIGPFGSGYNQDPESILFDKSGNAYVGQADGTRDILKFSSTGAPLASFNPTTGPRGTDWIDLAADQQTMFYSSEGGLIRRFNVATNTQLADFANVGGSSFGLRLLGDGGLLVAHSGNVLRLDSTGAVTHTYTASGEGEFFALNLDPDGKTFWTAGYLTDKVYHFDIASGALINSFTETKGSGTLSGLAVFGEITQGGSVPEPTMILPSLAGFGILVWFRRRSRRTI